MYQKLHCRKGARITMKDLSYLDEYRIPLLGNYGDEHNGFFVLKIKGEKYRIMASNGCNWEHVSISHDHKIPSWTVMCMVKDMFFEEHECVVQYHPPKSEYINNHPRCLHLWKPLEEDMPVPPSILIGV